MIELRFVHTFELVNYTYHFAVLVEAKSRGYPLLDLTSPQAEDNAKSFNTIVRWLVKKYPSEFTLYRGKG